MGVEGEKKCTKSKEVKLNNTVKYLVLHSPIGRMLGASDGRVAVAR